jgi:hypothetical protein
VAKFNTPTPDPPAGYGKNYWKWSVFAQRNFGSMSIIGQAASDHFRIKCLLENDQDYEQALPRHGDWYYMLKVKFGF